MAGIAGWVQWPAPDRQQQQVLGDMIEQLEHRGGSWQRLWLGSGAAAPRTQPDPTITYLKKENRAVALAMGGRRDEQAAWTGQENSPRQLLLWDGEIYNGAALRQTLGLDHRGAAGHRAPDPQADAGVTDAQLVLQAWRRWGRAAWQRLEGPFSLALWDAASHTLTLARDPLGIRPLFFARRGNTLIFASELKALLAHPLVEPRVDGTGLAEIWVLGPARTPGCGVFKNVDELQAGQCLTFTGGSSRLFTYWRPQDAVHPHDPAATAQKVGRLLRTALRQQLAPVGETALMLSGGLDSSLLTALAGPAFRQTGRQPVPTFAVSYAGEEEFFRRHAFQPDRDTPWADKVARFLQTRHTTVTLPAEQLVSALDTAVAARDLPGMADIDTSLYLFCRAIKEERPQTEFVVSGEGADEIFGGYPWFHRASTANGQVFPWSLHLEERTRLMAPELKATLRPASYLQQRFAQACSQLTPRPDLDPDSQRLRILFHLNLFYWLPTLLDRQDRMASAAGLRIRLPFCHLPLVEYAWNIPWGQKNMGGLAKGVLRRAFTGLLPDDVLRREKSPFPKTHNPAYLRTVQKALAQTMADANAPLRQLINEPAVATLLQGPAAATAHPWFGQLMAGPQLLAYLLQIDLWLRRYKVRLV